MFLEEKLSDCIDYGSDFSIEFAVREVSTSNGNSYPSRLHPYPKLRFNLGFANRFTGDQIVYVIDLNQRCGGRSSGFRVKHHAEFTTNNYRDAPTFADQVCALVSTGIYQMMVWYGAQGDTEAPQRRVLKPVTGTTLAGIRNATTGDHQITAFTVDTTTGQITLSTDKADAIVGITQAASAVIDFGAAHTYVVGDSVYISGVAGMTQINGRRGQITAIGATTITVNINSAAFSAYTSGGTTNTRPQTGEDVIAGCEFDIPVRFETDLDGVNYSNLNMLSSAISLIEWLNPS